MGGGAMIAVRIIRYHYSRVPTALVGVLGAGVEQVGGGVCVEDSL